MRYFWQCIQDRGLLFIPLKRMCNVCTIFIVSASALTRKWMRTSVHNTVKYPTNIDLYRELYSQAFTQAHLIVRRSSNSGSLTFFFCISLYRCKFYIWLLPTFIFKLIFGQEGRKLPKTFPKSSLDLNLINSINPLKIQSNIINPINPLKIQSDLYRNFHPNEFESICIRILIYIYVPPKQFFFCELHLYFYLGTMTACLEL